MAERKFYVVEKCDDGTLDISRLTSLSISIQEKLNEDWPVTVCKRKDTDKICFVTLATNAQEAKNRYENFIKIKVK